MGTRRWIPSLKRAAIALLVLVVAGCGDSAELERAKARTDAVQTRLDAALTAAQAAGAALATSREDAAAQGRRVAALQSQLRALNAEHAQLRAGLAGNTSTSLKAQGAAAATAREIHALRIRNAEQQRKLAALSALLGQHDAQSQTQAHVASRLRSEISTARDERDEVAAQLTAAQATSERLEEVVEAQIARIDQVEAEAKAREDRLRTDGRGLERALGELRTEANEITARNASLKSRLSQMRDQLAMSNELVERLRSAKDYLVVQVESMVQEEQVILSREHDARRAAREALAAGEQAQEEAAKALAALESRLRETTTSLRESETARVSLTEQLGAARDQLEASLRGGSQLEGKLAALTEELDATRSRATVRERRLEESLRLALEESRAQEGRAREALSELETARDGDARAALLTQRRRAAAFEDRARMLENTLNTLSRRALTDADAARKLAELEPQLAEAQTRARAVEGRAALLEQTLDHVFANREKEQQALEAALDAERTELNRQMTALRERTEMLERTAAFSSEQLRDAQAEIDAARDASARAAQCERRAQGRDQLVDDLTWGNELLLRENARLERRIEVLKIAGEECLRKEPGS